ncbi:ATP-binding protein [Draconibacterium sp.]|nr:ATP-binding protein [Draconibacterium sp.]
MINILNARFKSYFENNQQEFHFETISPNAFKEDSFYTRLLKKYKLKPAERLVLVLALIPHIQPHILDIFFTKNTQYDRGFTEFGGIKGNYFGGFLPTGETAMFILAANNLQKRRQYLYIFEEDFCFARENILWLQNPNSTEPFLSGVLTLAEDIMDNLCSGKTRKPRFGPDFPAGRINTQLEWKDLILENSTKDHINEIRAWIKHGHTLLHEWGLKKRIKPGYKSLFYGPSGTGKTLTASLIGKEMHRDVYRIDLSMVVSKYIGETEKNLKKVFDKAANKDWILFFDEADALFGKRTNVSDAHDRYANQEVSYLLQKIEDHPGLVILASNLKSNIDDAFTRRFQSIIHFPLPKAPERYQIWKRAFSKKSELEKSIDLRQIANKYDFSGGSIVNIVRYASLMALYNNTSKIQNNWIMSGIRKEYQKEGKTF